MAPRRRKSKASSSSKVDLISNLPKEIREKILTYLPIKEAGRTSVLSSAWRETWTSIPVLRIRDSDCRTRLYPSNIVKLVDTILALRGGPVRKFCLRTRVLCPDAYDRWILYLSRNGIKVFKLYLGCIKYKIPLSFFSCNALTSICLHVCTVELPRDFKGFEFVRNLILNTIVTSEDYLEKLVSHCPVLENLHLRCLINCNVLTIRAPNLKFLTIHSKFTALNLHAPKLVTLYAGLYKLPFENESDLEQAFGFVPNLESLMFRENIVDFFCARQVVREFPLMFHNLKKIWICLDMNFKDKKPASFVTSLLKNTPNLVALFVEMIFDSEKCPESLIPNLWDAKDFSLPRLKLLHIHGYEDMDNANAFLEFVLGSSPELMKLSIEPPSYFYESLEFNLKSLLKIPIASKKVRIVVK